MRTAICAACMPPTVTEKRSGFEDGADTRRRQIQTETLPMNEVRCLYCRHWRPDDENPDAAERKLEMRYGPEVALGGDCHHPERKGLSATNSKWSSALWEERPARTAPTETA